MYKITCSSCGQLLGALLKKPPIKMNIACKCGNKGIIQNTKSTTHFVLTKSGTQKKSTKSGGTQKRSSNIAKRSKTSR